MSSGDTGYFRTRNYNYLVESYVSPTITVSLNALANSQKKRYDEIVSAFIYGHFEYWENKFLPTGNRVLVSEFKSQGYVVFTVFWQNVFHSYLLSEAEGRIINSALANKVQKIDLGWIRIDIIL